MRCDHCQYRNSWDCEDECRIEDNTFCNNFKLDFDTLNKKQKRIIQSQLMFNEENKNSKRL